MLTSKVSVRSPLVAFSVAASFLTIIACGRVPQTDHSTLSHFGEETDDQPAKTDARLIGAWVQNAWIYTYTLEINSDGSSRHIAKLKGSGTTLLDVDTKQIVTFTEESPHRAIGDVSAVRVSEVPNEPKVTIGDTFNCIYGFDKRDKVEDHLKLQCSYGKEKPTTFDKDKVRLLAKMAMK